MKFVLPPCSLSSAYQVHRPNDKYWEYPSVLTCGLALLGRHSVQVRQSIALYSSIPSEWSRGQCRAPGGKSGGGPTGLAGWQKPL